MRRPSSVALVLALAAGAVWALARLLAPPAPSIDEEEGIRVAMAQGAVERRASDTRWEQVRVGSELSLNDAIRTGADGRAKLDVGSVADIEIAPRSEFSVRELSRSVSRLRLHEGRLSAVVAGDGGTLRVEGRDGSASAEAQRATFSVAVSPQGSMTVASEQGEVRVSAREQSLQVARGTQVVIAPGEVPSAPAPIPGSLFLKIERPPLALRERELVLAGETAPYAIVSVNGIEVPASSTGAFRARVPLREGHNSVVVEASDVAGRHERAELPPVLVDTKAPPLKSRTDWSEKERKAEVEW